MFPLYLPSAITFSSHLRATLTVSLPDLLGPHQSIKLCVLRERPKVDEFLLNHFFVSSVLAKYPGNLIPGVTQSILMVHAS